MNEPEIRRYSSRRLSLSYCDWGNANLPTLVLVHGRADHARSWDWTARALRDRFHVIAPDLVGHGDSDWDTSGGYQLQGYILDLAELVRQLGKPPVDIVAHSLGGYVALRYAASFPENVRRLVAVEGMTVGDDVLAAREAVPAAERLRKWIAEVQARNGRPAPSYPSVEEVARRLREKYGRFSAEQALHLARHTVRQGPDGNFTLKGDPYVMLSRPVDVTLAERRATFAAIACEVLLVHGADSFLPNPATDGRARLIRGARTVSLDRAGHWVQHDRFDGFLTEIQRFL